MINKSHEIEYKKLYNKLKSHPINQWIIDKGWQWFPHQIQILKSIEKNNSILVQSPTGTGKTLTGFLPSLLNFNYQRKKPKLDTLYVSPLKALTIDIHRNISKPIKELNLSINLETRTGDTSQNIKSRQIKNPPDFLMTTPESLALLLSNQFASTFFKDLEFVIIDEIHTFLNNKRGDLLSLNLARLFQIARGAKRIGLSATIKTPSFAMNWLSPDKTDLIQIKNEVSPNIEIFQPDKRIPWSGHTGIHAISEIYKKLLGIGKTIIFVNTRGQAEFVFHELWNNNIKKYKIAIHHGSLDLELRKKVETKMSQGILDCVVATSSLDLGIDWAEIDLVIQIGAPKGLNRLIQRIGRSNHRYNQPSRAFLVPTNRFEYLECFAATNAIKKNFLDDIPVKKGALDVLAQYVYGTACSETFEPKKLYNIVSSTAPYKHLSFENFLRVVNFVKDGGYALKNYEKYKRLKILENGQITVNSKADIRRYKMNIGTIIEAPMLNIKLKNRTLGKIEENFIINLSIGDTFIFGGEVLEFQKIEGLNVYVKKSKNKESKITVYAGGRLPLSTELSKSVRELIGNKNYWKNLPTQIQDWLFYQERQSILPNPNNMVVEIFPYKKRFYTVIHSFLGWNANQTLGFLLLRRMKRAGFRPMGFSMNDYGLAVWSFKKPQNVNALLDNDIVFEEFEEWLQDTPLLKRLFRDIALISGLVEKRIPGSEKTGKQVLFSTDLIYEVLTKYDPKHILLEAVKEDAMDGFIDGSRLRETLHSMRENIEVKYLDQISPLSLPIILDVTKENIGYSIGKDDILAEMQEQNFLIK